MGAYLAAAAAASARVAWVTPRRLAPELRERLGAPAAALLGGGFGAESAAAYLWAGASMAHGVVLPAI